MSYIDRLAEENIYGTEGLNVIQNLRGRAFIVLTVFISVTYVGWQEIIQYPLLKRSAI